MIDVYLYIWLLGSGASTIRLSLPPSEIKLMIEEMKQGKFEAIHAEMDNIEIPLIVAEHGYVIDIDVERVYYTISIRRKK